MLVPELCILLCILVDASTLVIPLLYKMINALEPHLKILLQIFIIIMDSVIKIFQLVKFLSFW